MVYVYPAIFSANNDGSYTVTFPDLPGCISEGKTLSSALTMAQLALTQWMGFLKETNQNTPKASDIRNVVFNENEFASMVCAEVKNGRAVKRTVSLPKWMDEKVSEMGLSLSRVLQEAISQKIR